MKKEEFIELYHRLTLKELCKLLNCSTTVIYSLLDRYDIPHKHNKYRDYSYLRGKRSSKITLN